MAKLLSVNVGLPRDIAWRGETIHTAVWKEAINGSRLVTRLNVAGDGQGDLAGHGGEHRAVLVYQIESYRYWEKQLQRVDFTFGQFGENFTVEGLPDDQVCIGDRYRIGAALFEVTQPRVTCYRVGIRMGEPAMAALLVSHHRPGFYFRVLEEGEVTPGDAIVKVADGPESVTVAQIDSLLYMPGHPREQAEKALRIPALSPGWKGSLQALLDAPRAGEGNPGLSPTEEPRPAWSGFRPLLVTRIVRESANVASLTFKQPDGAALPLPLPGQFLVLKLSVGAGVQVLRNYSLSGPPASNAYRISVKQEVNGIASSYLHNHVAVGDTLEISAPRGAFFLAAGNAPVVLMSAGVGATPVLAMLHSLASPPAAREVWWLYGARNGREHPFAAESNAILKTIPGSHRHIAYSKPEPADQLGRDYDSEGRLHIGLLEKLHVPRDAEFYLCGPSSFLEDLTNSLKERGTPAAQIHSETFGPRASMTPGIAAVSRPRPHSPAGAPGRGPNVSFTRSGLVVPWNQAFKSILDFAEACDVPAKWSCRTGVCHTCETALIGGEVQYDPEPLDRPSEGRVLICCAQPKGELAIEL